MTSILGSSSSLTPSNRAEAQAQTAQARPQARQPEATETPSSRGKDIG